MPDFDPTLRQRIANLERDVAELRRLLSRGVERPAEFGAPRNPRLAVTAADPDDDSYPESGDSPTVYWIKFFDAEFTDEVGAQTLSVTNRTADARVKCYNLLEKYLPEDTRIWVFFYRGRWYACASGDNEQLALLVRGATTAAVLATDATFTLGSLAVMFFDGGTIVDVDSGQITVNNPHGFAIDNGGLVTVAWNAAVGKYDAIQANCPA